MVCVKCVWGDGVSLVGVVRVVRLSFGVRFYCVML